MYENLMTYNNYAIMRGVTQQSIRDWRKKGRIDTVEIDGRLFVVLTEEEVKERRKNNE